MSNSLTSATTACWVTNNTTLHCLLQPTTNWHGYVEGYGITNLKIQQSLCESPHCASLGTFGWLINCLLDLHRISIAWEMLICIYLQMFYFLHTSLFIDQCFFCSVVWSYGNTISTHLLWHITAPRTICVRHCNITRHNKDEKYSSLWFQWHLLWKTT